MKAERSIEREVKSAGEKERRKVHHPPRTPPPPARDTQPGRPPPQDRGYHVIGASSAFHSSHTWLWVSRVLFKEAVMYSILLTSLILECSSNREGGSFFFHFRATRHRAAVRTWARSFLESLENEGGGRPRRKSLGQNGTDEPNIE